MSVESGDHLVNLQGVVYVEPAMEAVEIGDDLGRRDRAGRESDTAAGGKAVKGEPEMGVSRLKDRPGLESNLPLPFLGLRRVIVLEAFLEEFALLAEPAPPGQELGEFPTASSTR